MGNSREDIGNRSSRRISRNSSNSSNSSNRRRLTPEEKLKIKKRIEAKKRKRRRKRRIVSLLTILIVLLVGVIGYVYFFIGSLKTNTLGTGVAPASSKDPINILVLGMDIGDSTNTENKSIRRSDTIMVFNYNPNTKKAHLVSIPRDTLIEVDGYTGDGEYRKYWKINTAYALGGEEEVITHVESLLNIDINYIVEIDYNAFRSIIDALGGIEMTIDQDMYYDDDAQDLHINFTAGETVLLDGKKAEEFFRWRKNNDGTGGEEGDLGRINNQQKFISKVVDKVLSPSIIFKTPKILKAISDNVDTNIPANKLISLGMKILKLKPSDIVMTTLKGEAQYIYGESFIISDYELNKDLINSLNAMDNSVSDSIMSVSRENLNILVLNGTKIDGLASNARDKLYSLGYSKVEVGNSTQAFSKSVIETNKKELKNLLKNDLDIEKFSKISDSQYKDYDAVIILGSDYNLFGE